MLIQIEELTAHGFQPTGVIHVGAHTGEEQELYDQLKVKRVVWIEAIKELADELRDKYKDRKDVTVINALISDKKERVPFYVTNNRASSSMLRMGTHEQSHPTIFVTREEIHLSTTLRSLGLHGFDTLNLDIQGAELKALKGADLTNIKYIYTEVNIGNVYENCALMYEIDEYLHDYERVATKMTKYNWGDALYIKR